MSEVRSGAAAPQARNFSFYRHETVKTGLCSNVSFIEDVPLFPLPRDISHRFQSAIDMSDVGSDVAAP